MKQFLILCWCLFCCLFLRSFPLQAKKSDPPLPPKKIESSLASVDQAIEAMYVASDVLTIPPEFQNRYFAEQDLSLVEVQAIEDLIALQDPKSEIMYVRYTNGDLRVVEALIRAKKAGVKVSIVTDFNTVMKGVFKDGQKITTDFENAEFNKKPNGELEDGAKAIRTLLDNGFKIGVDLVSQPLYLDTGETQIPIMHIKGMVLQANGKTTTWFGTNNASRNQRYNRLFKVVDPLFGFEFLSYLKDLSAIFQEQKAIDKTVARPPVEISYKDGTTLRISFTQGRFNTNDDQIELLKTAQLKQFYASHFAPAYNGWIQALYENLEKVSPKATGTYVVDDRFGSPDGWGAMIRLSGFNILLPYGRMIFGIKNTVASRIQGWVYQRYSLDPDTGLKRIELSEDGAPEERHVWHDKTTLYNLVNEQAHIFTGSFNASSNFANAEIQAHLQTTSGSWLTRAIQHSIEDVIEKEKGLWAISVYEATVRNSVGTLTGHTDLEVPLGVARELIAAFRASHLESANTALRKMIDLPSNLEKKLSPIEIKDRIEKFILFYKWYLEKAAGSISFSDARLRRMILIPFLLTRTDLDNYTRFSIMESVVWYPQISNNEVLKNKLVLEGLATLGITDVSIPNRKAKVGIIPKALKESLAPTNILSLRCQAYFQ